MRKETRKLIKSIQQCESFSIANLRRSILTNLDATAKQNGAAEEKRKARKAIVTLLMKRNLVTAAGKQEMSITEKCSDV
eukprot:9270788-Ditylum_brightwellii.AAC.1